MCLDECQIVDALTDTGLVPISQLLSQGVDPKKVLQTTGKDGQVFQFKGFTVQPVLGRHGEPDLFPFTGAYGKVFQEAYPATPEQRAAEAVVAAKGSSDPHIVDQGTLAFIITFDDGFRLAYRDSGGAVTDYEKAAMARIGKVDILIGAIAANTIAAANASVLMPMIETYQPAVYFPAHHEEEAGHNVDRATEPMFQSIKEKFPETLTISKEFREPTCFDTRLNLKSDSTETSRR